MEGPRRGRPRTPWVTALGLALLLGGTALRADFNVYWGDVHGHTGHSDGRGSLDDYFTFARDTADLDFVVVTDHDFGNAPPWRLPTNTWSLTQAKADAFNVNGRFVALAGYEWTSQPKYWTQVEDGAESERLFPGPPRYYNHKIVILPSRVKYLFSAKDPAFATPDHLARAVRSHGGLIHNAHPSAGPEGRDQFEYAASNASVIANTEMLPDDVGYLGTRYAVRGEETVRAFLNRGGRTGFVGGSDTHEGTPSPRTAVLALELTREAVLDALRNRRNYAVTGARIHLQFRINGHVMGEDIRTEGPPVLTVEVRGTYPLREVAVVRNGVVIDSRPSPTRRLAFRQADPSFPGEGYYYVRVTQADSDLHGNPSQAWSSPIWVRGPGAVRRFRTAGRGRCTGGRRRRCRRTRH